MKITSSKFSYIIKLFSGPILFLLINSLEIGSLAPEGKTVLALYAWIIAWWVARPLPWSIAALLPLIVIPVCGLMKIGDVASFYGQNLLFFLIGVLSLGRAVEKYGLGKRIALSFLSKTSKSGSIYKILASFLIIVAIISAFVDDAATIAICIPIGVSIINYVQDAAGCEKCKKLSLFMILGVLYASEAGGIMSVAGIPHIAVALSILEKTTGLNISFLQWSSVGVVIGIVSFILYFLVLSIMCKPEIKKIDNVQEIFVEQKKSLGKMTAGEKSVTAVFALMLILWLLPSIVQVSFLNVWIVPVIGCILLYVLPAGGENRVLDANDFQKHLPWDIVFLVLGGGVMASLSTEFGVIEWLQSMIPTGTSPLPLMLLSAFSTAGLSNFISGSATVNIMSNIFMPIASQIGANPILFAYILPASGMAILLPWAGAATSTTFSTGKLEIRDMVKCGLVATIIHIFAIVTVTGILVPVMF